MLRVSQPELRHLKISALFYAMGVMVKVVEAQEWKDGVSCSRWHGKEEINKDLDIYCDNGSSSTGWC